MSVLFRGFGQQPTSSLRALRWIAAMVAVTALLASCGNNDDVSDEPPTEPETTAPADGEEAAPEATTPADEEQAEPEATAPADGEEAAPEATTPADEEQAEPEGPPGGGTLTFGIVAIPPSLNPGIGDPAYNAVYQWAYDPLVFLQPDGTFAPGLAVEFGHTDDRNMRYELTLREGVKFSDGTDLDAEAVKGHFDYVRSQPTALAQQFARVEDITVTGPLSLVIELSEPDPGLTFNLAQGFGGGNIISPKGIESPETLDLGTAGAGPYILVAADSVVGDTYTFVPNPHYWNPDRIHWDEVVLRVIPNSSSMVEAIRAGQIQAGQGDPTTMAAAADAGISVLSAPQVMFGLNLVDRHGEVSAPLGDERVRRALNHGVDREALAAALLGDTSLTLSQYAIEGQRGYDPSLNAVNAYNPDRARQLLAEAGYGDGVTIGVLTVSLFSLDTMVEAVAGQLAEVGVALDITAVADPTSYFVGMTSKEHPAVALAYGLGTMQSLHVGFIDPLGPFNPFGVVDEQLDSLYEEYFSTVGDSSDVEQRINARLVDQAWALPVMASPIAWYVAEGLTGIEATGGNGAIPTLADLRRE